MIPVGYISLTLPFLRFLLEPFSYEILIEDDGNLTDCWTHNLLLKKTH